MMNTNTNEFDVFLDTLVEELIEMPDEQVLEGKNPESVRAGGLSLLEAAKAAAGRLRLAAAKTGYVTSRSRIVSIKPDVSVDVARRFIASAKNDARFTIAARNLGELTDAEVLDLYRKIKALQAETDGTDS